MVQLFDKNSKLNMSYHIMISYKKIVLT